MSHETVRFWRQRFGPMFATEIRRKRVAGLRASRRPWHLDEVFVPINFVLLVHSCGALSLAQIRVVW